MSTKAFTGYTDPFSVTQSNKQSASISESTAEKRVKKLKKRIARLDARIARLEAERAAEIHKKEEAEKEAAKIAEDKAKREAEKEASRKRGNSFSGKCWDAVVRAIPAVLVAVATFIFKKLF
jgi:hypothetical protein